MNYVIELTPEQAMSFMQNHQMDTKKRKDAVSDLIVQSILEQMKQRVEQKRILREKIIAYEQATQGLIDEEPVACLYWLNIRTETLLRGERYAKTEFDKELHRAQTEITEKYRNAALWAAELSQENPR